MRSSVNEEIERNSIYLDICDELVVLAVILSLRFQRPNWGVVRGNVVVVR